MLEKNPESFYKRPPTEYKYLLNCIGVPHTMLTEDIQFTYNQVIDSCSFDYLVGTAIRAIWLFNGVDSLRDAKWHLERFNRGIYHIIAIECLEKEIAKLM